LAWRSHRAAFRTKVTLYSAARQEQGVAFFSLTAVLTLRVTAR
jgi:hypothetical protein